MFVHSLRGLVMMILLPFSFSLGGIKGWNSYDDADGSTNAR
jgi:hypothetical protein